MSDIGSGKNVPLPVAADGVGAGAGAGTGTGVEDDYSNSAYMSLFNTGKNPKLENMIADMFTETHSKKIKAGNQLEKDVADDVKKNSSYTMYDKSTASSVEPWAKNKNRMIYSKEAIDCLKKPCVISGLRFPKSLYEEHGLICKNKTSVEVDFTIITEEEGVTKIRLVELKNGCNFDTKKSKGEVQSLEATKTLCESTGFETKPPAMVCYDAKSISDIIIKTSLEGVELMIYETMASEMGLCGDSRGRIEEILKGRAEDNIREVLERMKTILHLADA